MNAWTERYFIFQSGEPGRTSDCDRPGDLRHPWHCHRFLAASAAGRHQASFRSESDGDQSPDFAANQWRSPDW